MKNALMSGSVFGDPVRFSLPYPLSFLADALRHGGSVPHRAVSTTAVSVVLTGVLPLLVRPIVSVMSTPAAAVEGTVAYLTVCFLGMPFITAYDVISSVFRGMGDSKSPMIFVAVACAANIAPDHLFMGALLSVPICLIAFAVLWCKKSG